MDLMKDLQEANKGKSFEDVRNLILWQCEHQTPKDKIRQMIAYIDSLEAQIKDLENKK